MRRGHLLRLMTLPAGPMRGASTATRDVHEVQGKRVKGDRQGLMETMQRGKKRSFLGFLGEPLEWMMKEKVARS